MEEALSTQRMPWPLRTSAGPALAAAKGPAETSVSSQERGEL